MDACGEVVNNVIYHTDSVESTSKCFSSMLAHGLKYTILTLWSQLQNRGACCFPWRALYHTDSVESTSKWPPRLAGNPAQVYHTDSVESTSKSLRTLRQRLILYTILTLWSQLQNNAMKTLVSITVIPY